MLKIRRSRDPLIFNMGIPIPGKDGLYIETGPRLYIYTLYRGCCYIVYTCLFIMWWKAMLVYVFAGKRITRVICFVMMFNVESLKVSVITCHVVRCHRMGKT